MATTGDLTQSIISDRDNPTDTQQRQQPIRARTYVQLMGVCAAIGQIPLQSVPIIKLDEGEEGDMNERTKCDGAE